MIGYRVQGIGYRAMLFFILALFLTNPVFAKDVKFEVSLDKNRIALGETAQLGLSFYGTQSMPAPDIGNIDGLEVRYLGPSTMMTMINGQVSSSVTHMYTVLPLRIGKFQIGPLSFKYKGDNYTSSMAFLEVMEERTVSKKEAEPESAEKLNLEDKIFITLDVSKTTAYVNELIPVTVKLYISRLNVSDIQLPTFDQEGFSKVAFKEPKEYREETSGIIYYVFEFKTNIFSTRSGDYKLGPAKIKCNVLVKKRLARGALMRDDFSEDEYAKDSFFDDFFTRYERHPLELKTQSTQLVVSPLPTEGRPKDFSGAVGDYQFIFEAGPTKLKVGDPVTIRMTINGKGNFNTVLMPALESTDEFKAYEPQVKTDENSKTFAQVLIPESDLVTQIPQAAFNYFDPIRKEYKRIKQGPITIKVEKGHDEAPSQVIGPSPSAETLMKEESLARDIIYIKEVPGRLARLDYQIYKKKIFIVIILLPLLFLISLYMIQKKKNKMRRDSAYAGRIASFRIAKKGLKKLRNKLKTQAPRAFYEAVFKTLQDYLGNRLDMPTAGMTSNVAEEVLASRDVDLDILRKLKGLFDTCDRVRFSFSETDEYKMKDDLLELEEVINYFERKKL